MDFRDLIKTAEGLIVLIGLFLTLTFGKVFALITAGAYLLVNVKGWWPKVKTFLLFLWRQIFPPKNDEDIEV